MNPCGKSPVVVAVVPDCDAPAPTLDIFGDFLALLDQDDVPIEPTVTFGETLTLP